MVDTGDRFTGVQVLTPHGSTSSGMACLPQPAMPASGNVWDLSQSTSRDVLAAVVFYGRTPVIVGFRFPQVCQMLFADLNRAINRHPSDFYTMIDGQGNFEAYHPSGTFISIGLPTHNDLTGKDVDGQWKIANNTGSAPHVHIGVANAGSPVASFDIDPSGNIAIQGNGNTTLNITGNVTATVGGNVQATVSGTTEVDSSGAATLKAPSVTVDSPQSTFTGAVTVRGGLTFENGMTGSAGTSGGATMNITGDATFTGTVSGQTDVLAAGKSGKGHTHGGVQSGGSQTDEPT